MFSNDTGVGMKGHVLLNSGAVRQHWLNVSSRLCFVLFYFTIQTMYKDNLYNSFQVNTIIVK